MPEVTLTPDDYSVALHLATDRMVESLRNNRKDTLFEKDWLHALSIHVLGAVGEIAFAKWMGDYPRFGVKQFSGMDSDHHGDIEIRHRSNRGWDLKIVDKDDPSRKYVLTRGLPPVVEVAGWAYGHEVMSDEYRANHGGYGECWFVPCNRLRPMEEIKRASNQ